MVCLHHGHLEGRLAWTLVADPSRLWPCLWIAMMRRAGRATLRWTTQTRALPRRRRTPRYSESHSAISPLVRCNFTRFHFFSEKCQPAAQGGWVSFVFFLPLSRFFSCLLPPAHVSRGCVGERHGHPSAPCAAVAGCALCDECWNGCHCTCCPALAAPAASASANRCC